jgi:hypothetical protein
MWQSWIVLFLSLWLVFGIGLLGATPGGPQVNYLAVGIICFVLGLWSLVESPRESRRALLVLIVVGGLWLGSVAFLHVLQGTIMAVIIGTALAVLAVWSAVPRPPKAAPQAGQ